MKARCKSVALTIEGDCLGGWRGQTLRRIRARSLGPAHLAINWPQALVERAPRLSGIRHRVLVPV